MVFNKSVMHTKLGLCFKSAAWSRVVYNGSFVVNCGRSSAGSSARSSGGSTQSCN